VHDEGRMIPRKALVPPFFKKIDMKNWRTFVGGILGSVSVYLLTLSEPIWHTVGLVLSALSPFIIGASASDAVHVSNLTEGKK